MGAEIPRIVLELGIDKNTYRPVIHAVSNTPVQVLFRQHTSREAVISFPTEFGTVTTELEPDNAVTVDMDGFDLPTVAIQPKVAADVDKFNKGFDVGWIEASLDTAVTKVDE